MKINLILLILIVVLLGTLSNGTVGSFKDSETSTDNHLIFLWEEECPHGKFNVANDGADDEVFMYDEYGALLGDYIINLHDDNAQPSGVASTGEYIYVLDKGNKRMYRYTYC